MARNKRKRARGEGAVYSYRTTGKGELRWRVEPVGGGAGGKAGFKTQAEALEWQRRNQGPPAAGTVGEWLVKWLALNRPDWKPASYRRIAFSVNRWILPSLGSLRTRDLTAIGVKSFLAEMARRGAKDPERHKVGAHLRQALNAAVACGVMPSNPMTGANRVKLPSPRHPEKKAFDEAQVRALVAAADAQGKGHAIRLWLDCGLRPSELLALDWEDIDPERGTVRVTKAWDSLNYVMSETKTRGSRRVIRLSAATVEALNAVRGSGPLLSPPRSKGGRYWQSEFWRAWWTPVLEAAGLAGLGFSPYTCRHTMATHLLRAGVPILTVSRRLGHSSAKQTLTTYAHLMEGDDDRAAEEMGRFLG
jgi:integrase